LTSYETDSLPLAYLNARLRSVGHALRGISSLLRDQPNARLHALATVLVIVAGALLRISPVEWGLIALAVACVWAAEAMNTAVEAVVDLISAERQALAAKAKDVAAGAVLLAACGSVVIGLLVFVPHLLRMFG
jgi:diacylglycerol kinase